jgi:glyoxylase-like metal-dependent hydrolase (beta-lactamase superfamily II)
MDSQIITVDCNYIQKGVACAYIILEGDRVSIVENNTNYAIPILISRIESLGLKPTQVDYCIITHVHLDHAGGTSRLMELCPNATLLAHPRSAKHIIDPSRLIQSAKEVYGLDAFNQLYGEILPVPESRVRIMDDGEILNWGKRTFQFIYTKGHANHHFCIFEKKSNSIFTGDSFGIAYPSIGGKGNFIFPTTTPTDFDYQEALISIDKIVATGAETAYLTHFGDVQNLPKLRDELKTSLTDFYNIALDSRELKDKNLRQNFIEENLRKTLQSYAKGKSIELNSDQLKFLENDIRLNASGLNHWASKAN